MEYYVIKYVDENGNILDADVDQYPAKNELDALHQFTKARASDILIENVEIINDDPKNYMLKIRGWFHNEVDNLFQVHEDTFEYFAERVEE